MMHGAFTGWHGVSRDISERERVEGASGWQTGNSNLPSSVTRHDINNQIMGLRAYVRTIEEKHHTASFTGKFVKEDQAVAGY